MYVFFKTLCAKLFLTFLLLYFKRESRFYLILALNVSKVITVGILYSYVNIS